MELDSPINHIFDIGSRAMPNPDELAGRCVHDDVHESTVAMQQGYFIDQLLVQMA